MIRKSCAEDPTQRFESAAEFSAAAARLKNRTELDAQGPVLCRNTRCPQADWSPNGYYRGPRVIDVTVDRYCDACGSALEHHCAAVEPDTATVSSAVGAVPSGTQRRHARPVDRSSSWKTWGPIPSNCVASRDNGRDNGRPRSTIPPIRATEDPTMMTYRSESATSCCRTRHGTARSGDGFAPRSFRVTCRGRRFTTAPRQAWSAGLPVASRAFLAAQQLGTTQHFFRTLGVGCDQFDHEARAGGLDLQRHRRDVEGAVLHGRGALHRGEMPRQGQVQPLRGQTWLCPHEDLGAFEDGTVDLPMLSCTRSGATEVMVRSFRMQGV